MIDERPDNDMPSHSTLNMHARAMANVMSPEERCVRLTAEIASLSAARGEKRAPVQGFSAGIPWSMHLRAYEAYCKKWGKQDAMIDLEGKNCRGGFGVKELDDFIPGWREELSERREVK